MPAQAYYFVPRLVRLFVQHIAVRLCRFAVNKPPVTTFLQRVSGAPREVAPVGFLCCWVPGPRGDAIQAELHRAREGAGSQPHDAVRRRTAHERHAEVERHGAHSAALRTKVALAERSLSHGG